MGATIFAFDTEATGLDPTVDEIVQLTIVKYEVGKSWSDMEGYTSLFSTARPLPAGQALFCGLTPEDLAGKPTIGECIDSVLDILHLGKVFLSFNAPFDVGMLQAALKRTGSRRTLPMTMRNTIDPLIFSRGLYPHARGRKLAQMAARLGVRLNRAHDATSDTLAAAEVMVRMAVQNHLPPDLDALTTLQMKYAEAWSRMVDRPMDTW
jgi:DNA polymerase-3 subunit epsilon